MIIFVTVRVWEAAAAVANLAVVVPRGVAGPPIDALVILDVAVGRDAPALGVVGVDEAVRVEIAAAFAVADAVVAVVDGVALAGVPARIDTLVLVAAGLPESFASLAGRAESDIVALRINFSTAAVANAISQVILMACPVFKIINRNRNRRNR